MKKITLLLLLFFLASVNGYSQLTEGFEGEPSPTGPLPAFWTLPSSAALGSWAIFENNTPSSVVSTENWEANTGTVADGLQHNGQACAFVNREQIGAGSTSQDFLATPAVHVPSAAEGTAEMHFWTRLFTSGDQHTTFKLMVAPAGIDPSFQITPGAYTLVAQWSELDLIVPTSNFNVWTEKTVVLPSFLQGQDVYFAFVKEFTQTDGTIGGERWLIDDVGVNVQCAPPVTAATTGITSNSAVLNWTPANGAPSWEIQVVVATGNFGDAGTLTYPYTGSSPFTIPTGALLANTTYKYRVRAICSTGFSSDWSATSATFTTTVAPPVCGGNLVDSGGIGGNYSNGENSTVTVCPVNAGDLVTVSFTAFNTQADNDFLKIYDGNNASATLLANLSGTTVPPSYTSSAVTGCLTFVFTSNATTTAAGYAANIICNPAPACRKPTALTSNTITTTSAQLTWQQPANPDATTATAWEVLALPCGSAAPGANPTGIVPTTTNTNFLLGGLTSGSCYDIYVRAVCATNSEWSTPTRVNTLIAPPVCGGNFVDSGGNTGNYGNNETRTQVICPVNAGDAVTVTFTAFNTQAGSDILSVYDGNGVGSTLIASLSGTTLPPAFTSTSSTGCLTFQFISNATTTAAGWVANVSCAPQPTCAAPTSLAATATTHNSTTLNWAQAANPGGSTPTSWEVLAVPCGSPVPGATIPANGIVATATTNVNYVFSGLTSNTCFTIYVRAICAPGVTSTWTNIPATVTTLVAPPVCGGNFVDAGGTTGTYAANSNITTTICPTNPGDVVTVTFTAFDTEATWDALYVYNGNGVVPANIIPSSNGAGNVPGGVVGGYWGNTIPCPFTSSDANGCLTFVFRSDGSGQNAGWLANVTCGPPPACRIPTGITASAVTYNSVSLNWTQPANPDTSVANAWQVLVLPCGSPAPAANATGFIDVTTAPPYVLTTGLSPATCYNIYVRANCGTSVSAWPCTPITITTLAAPPVCGGNFVDAGGTAAGYAANSNVTTTICPTNPGDVVTVTFTSFNTESTFDALYVYNGSTVVPANLIPSTNPAGNVPGGLAGGYWGTTIPCPFTSGSADGCLTFVFRSDGSVQNPGWVANITCGPPPACRVPASLISSNVTHNSVVLNWTQAANADSSVASAWDVVALPCGSPAPGANPTGVVHITQPPTVPPYTLTGLTPSTCYDIYIRASCGPGVTSAWVCTPTTITTLVAPPECGGNFVDAGGATGNYANNSNITTIICPTNPGEIVTVTFTSFNTESTWDGLYVYNGNAVVPANLLPSNNGAGNVPGGLAGSYWGELTGNNLPGPFTSTTADGCLTFVFRSDTSGVNPGWVSNVTCSPAPTCARPVVVGATLTSQTSTTITWTQPNNPNGSLANAWEVLVLPAGSPVPTGPGIPVTSTTYLATGLTPGTAYVFYVRAICSPTDASTWAAYNFATLPTNDECSNALFAIVNQNLNCVQMTHGTLAGATASQPATTCGGAGAANDDVWFTFTATTVTHVISFNNVTPNTDLSYAIYQGTCGNLTQVGCNSGENLVAGTTYYIRVFSTVTNPVFTNFDMCIGTLPCTEAPAFCTGQTVTYANSTNVPSLGQIGCLFSSPNPAFFFLQVNQAGPLSYLISQVDNGGTPRDVDYVAWGPFTDLNTACTGVPANPLGQTVPIPTPATGCPGTLHACSYSIAPQEIMCIPDAHLCDVYVIMITNFSNQAGTVTFTQTNAGGGTTACFPINTFNYQQTYYCQGQPNPTPVLAPGASAGVYTSTPGLVIDSATGTINLAASTPGNYIITSTSATTIGGTCNTIPFITTTRTVIITAPAAATISYPAATYCNSITIPQAATRTGTAGGTYSASPAGLLLNGNTGDVIPVASTPGVYTVTYTIPATGGCPAFTTTTQVEILASPVITQASVAACNTFTLPALTVGNYYTAAGGPTGSGTVMDINTPITATQPVYIYAQGTNGCVTERQFNVTINTVPTPTFTVVQSSCTTPTGSITVTAPVAAGGALPANLFISEVTDADTGSLSYVELYNGTGAAVNLANYKLKFYTWGTASTAETLQCDLQLAGTIPNNATNVIKVSNNANISGVVPNQTFTGCAGVNNNDNIRLTTASGTEIDVWGRIDGTVFTPAGQTGYTYRRLATSTIPNTTWVPADWTAIDPEDYSDVGHYAYTVSTYQYSIDNGTTYQINPVFGSVAPGTYTLVVKDVTTGCVSAPVTVTVDAVNATTPVTTFSYTTPVCVNSGTNPLPNTTATGFTAGGTFTANPATGIDINASTGEINLANTTAGSYEITYGVLFDPTTCRSAGSSSFTIVISPVVTPVVGFTYTTPICKNAQATLSPGLVAGFTLGGTFSSTTGLVINASTGVIDLANSTAGTYSVTYAVAANASTCQVANSSSFTIVINPVIVPVTSFSYATPFCSSVTSSLESPTLGTGFTTGGTFSSTNGLIVNTSNGDIDLISTPGSYTITYSVAANAATCQTAASGTAQVTINPPVLVELTGGCQSKYMLNVAPVNGSFDPATATYSWQDSHGSEVGTTQSIVVPAIGTYTVTVTVNGCSTKSAPFEVTTIACQIQRGISVNNDGFNDTFDLTGFDVKELTIYNRYGMKVYSHANYVNEWGGKSDNGDELPDGTYFYVIDRNVGDNITGWIYINRAQ